MSLHPFPGFEPADQRGRELLAQADAARLRMLAGARRSAAVRIRPVRRNDDVLIQDCFNRLGPQSRLARFLGVKRALTPAELRYLTDVDHHDHEALIAVSRSDGSGLGVARFIRDGADPRSAEIAVTVIDEWQSRGLGTRLASRLAVRARSEGITRFTAVLFADNIRALRLLHQGFGSATELERDADQVHYEVQLAGSRRQL
jgi:GNAT superfamily N-acetyltransferase